MCWPSLHVLLDACLGQVRPLPGPLQCPVVSLAVQVQGDACCARAQGVNKLGDKRAESKCALVFGQMNEPPGARARVALTGLTIAEHFRDHEGQDVLLFVDNIFRFTQARPRPPKVARALCAGWLFCGLAASVRLTAWRRQRSAGACHAGGVAGRRCWQQRVGISRIGS